MSADVDRTDVIRVARNGERVVVCIVGRGSFNMAAPLKTFLADCIEKDPAVHLLFDMQACETMDSTFMGVVAGVSLKIRRQGAGEVTIVNLNPKTYALLNTLGVCRLLAAFEADSTPADLAQIAEQTTDFIDLAGPRADRLTNVETMLNAHRDLVRADPENRERFNDVIDYLSKDVEDLASSEE